MRKTLFFSILMLSLITNYAAYLIKGVNLTVPEGFKNYTLAINGSNEPVSFGSLNTSDAVGTEKNSIIAVEARNSLLNTCFPIVLPTDKPEAHYDIEVRDCQYHIESDIYVLCGSRGVIGSTTSAFVPQPCR